MSLFPRLVLLLAASLGLGIVARAAAMYRGTDSLAFALVLAIGAGLLIGLVELWQRAARADRLGRHLQSLPRPASLEAIETAPEPLRAMLLSRTTGSASRVQGASLATYLLGMLVMLGMLGTFLGLFESLRGAREALTATGGDVEALRAGLASPMVGLSRAFGTSATGVSASALLGLAMVFTRRAEARFSGELAAYASGPLLPLTMQGRTLAALETVASSTAALPATAAVLQAALSQMEQLEGQVARERKETSERLAELTQALVGEVRTSLAEVAKQSRASLEGAGQANRASLEALFEKTASILRESHREQLEMARAAREESARALRELSESSSTSLQASIEKAAEVLREASVEASSSLRSAGSETSASLRALGEETSASLRTLSDEAATSLRGLSNETSASLRALTQETSASLRSFGESTSASLHAIASEAAAGLRMTGEEQLRASRLVAEETGAAMRASAEAVQSAVERASGGVGEALSRATSEASQSMREAAAGLRGDLAAAVERAAEAAAQAVGPVAEQATARAGEMARQHLASWLERMERDADERQQGARELSEKLSSIVDSVVGNVGEIVEKTNHQASALRDLAEEVREQSQAISAASEARMTEIAEQARLILERQLEAHVELDERISRVQVELGGALVSRIEDHASELRETTTSTAALAKEAGELLRTGSAEIAAAAEMLTAAIDRHREASERWLDGVALSGQEPSGRPASGEILDDSFDRTREALAHLVELQREVITEVRALRPASDEAAEG